ncbi:MAG: hypothetical protein K8R34_16785 [Methanosarcinales archaeon]|nr:hypothetical protein [Methanosarcinales archaeon]
MNQKRVSLYDRLPEIYRIKDEEQHPPGQLKSYLALVECVFEAIHENIESLYHDLFIETCDDWVIPYIGDLLGTSHLSGDPWTFRADVADTIALRRRKGTLGAIELLTFNLTQWGVHCVELRERLVWNQHLNHQRPDEGGKPPYSLPSITIHSAIRGGTVTLRDPAMLSLLNTPFDPFAHIADVKKPVHGSIRYNLPNLAIFLWRLKAYQIKVSKPMFREVISIGPTEFPNAAPFVVRFDIHPLGEPVRLFNKQRFDPDKKPPVVTKIDETPGPIPTARLTEDSQAGNPEAYVTCEIYNHTDSPLGSLDISDVGLQLHLPDSVGEDWLFRGANLCAWEEGLNPPLRNHEIAIDPVIGRIALGIGDEEGEGNALGDHLLLTYTYGAVGPVGAHPVSHSPLPDEWEGKPIVVNYHIDQNGLQNELTGIQDSVSPIIIEIHDSMIHEIDIRSIELNNPLIIRAADYQHPIIKLAQPLRFRPTNVIGYNDEEQRQFDEIMSSLTVRLEGLYITRSDGWMEDENPLIAGTALHSLEIVNCTLDPGGFQKLDGTRETIHSSMKLDDSYGLDTEDEKAAFNQIPEIIILRSITGPLFIDRGYILSLTSSIIDAGSGVNDDPATAALAVSGSSGDYGPETHVDGITVFGGMWVESISGSGGIWVHTLNVLNDQKGCIKFSYFSGKEDRLPQNHGCVDGTEAYLRFTSEIFGNPAYGQLAHTTDFRIRERGPEDDAMGAFGFLKEAHKWRNIQIRYREFMPVGVRPLLIPVT